MCSDGFHKNTFTAVLLLSKHLLHYNGHIFIIFSLISFLSLLCICFVRFAVDIAGLSIQGQRQTLIGQILEPVTNSKTPFGFPQSPALCKQDELVTSLHDRYGHRGCNYDHQAEVFLMVVCLRCSCVIVFAATEGGGNV